MKYYSQYNQDRFVDEVILNKKTSGSFIDIGAHDGITYSNSAFFEKSRKFVGICVEPNPIVFKKLKNNRNSVNLNACIGLNNGKATFLSVEGYGEMLSGLLEFYNDAHKNRIDEVIAKHGGSKKEIEVDVINFDTMLLNLKNSQIDFCSIDTEGNELSILTSINFNNNSIKCFSIENNYNDSRISDFMRNNGYREVIRLGCDTVYLKNDLFTFSIKVRKFIFQLKSYFFSKHG
jgi:FkbM family methyltransferase